MKSKGVVAAGSPGTAQVGADILAAGGNAVDAVCASCFATAVHEPALTSLAGGGVMLVHLAQSNSSRIIDFLTNAPGYGGERPAQLDFLPATLDFGSAQQIFHIGRGSVAVPGTLLGLGMAQEKYGRLPLPELLAPVVAALRRGVVLDAFQARTLRLLGPILTHSKNPRDIYAPSGHVLGEGERFSNCALAAMLQTMGEQGVEPFYHGTLVPMMLREFGRDAGGWLTAQDIERYRVEVSAPLTASYRGVQLKTHVWPSHGGTLVALMLKLLEPHRLGEKSRAQALPILAAAMRVAELAKKSGVDPLQPEQLQQWQQRCQDLVDGGKVPTTPSEPGPGSTTHVSVIDGDGNAAAVTLSYGEGCGYTLGDTGLILNNFLGEEDLFPQGFFSVTPGQRIATNMCPTLVFEKDRMMILGSGGANRIRTAIAQVIVNIVDFAMDPQQAVNAGRIHVEDGVVNAEVYDLDNSQALLKQIAGDDEVVAFKQANLFFGGVHLAARTQRGELLGAGDLRRSGAVVFAGGN